MKPESKKSHLLAIFAFIISLINFSGTIISLITTDGKLLNQRLSFIADFIVRQKDKVHPDAFHFVAYCPQFWQSYLVLSILLVIITFYEWRYKKIPHSVTMPGIFLGIALTVMLQPSSIWNSVIGATLSLVIFLTIFYLTKGRQIGFGVVMMEGMLGAFVGVIPLLIINGIAYAGVLIYALFMLARHPQRHITTIEFGPLLATATSLYLLWLIYSPNFRF